MNSTTILILVATVAVIALTLIPTYIISGRKKTTQADWEVADRSLPLYVVIGTQFASAMGGGILVAHVGNAYTRGIGHFIYGVLASLPFIIIMVLAKWLRRNNFTTIPDVLAHFTNGNKLIRIVAGVMTVFVPFGWVTSQITAFGNIYSNLTGIDYTLLCVLFAVFALLAVLRLFAVPLKLAGKLLVNTLLGFALLGILSALGVLAKISLGLNLFNALVIAVLGVPGLALLILLRLVFI